MPRPEPDAALPVTRMRIADGLITVECDPGAGFIITSIRDEPTGAEALWTRTGFTQADFLRYLGPSGDASVETFIDLFVGGWFEMFPTSGFPGALRSAVGTGVTLLHGEVMRLPWQVLGRSDAWLEARVSTLRTPFELTRRLSVEAGQLLIEEHVRNVAESAAPFTWGHHPCFSRLTFSGGRIELDVVSAEVPAPPFDEINNSLSPGAAFDFPLAPTREGGWRDVSLVPASPDGRHEQVALRLRTGRLRITAPGVGRCFTLDWDVKDLPCALVWQDYGAAGMSFWGTCDTFAVEPSSAPGRSVDDAVAAEAVRYLEPGETASLTLRAGWSPLEPRSG